MLYIGGQLQRGDVLLAAIERSDLVPIPRTIELTLLHDDDLFAALAVGNVVEFGDERTKYRILKRYVPPGHAGAQGERVRRSIKVTGLMDSVADVATLRKRSVLLKATTIGSAYRACGAKVAIGTDFAIDRFASQIGECPTTAIARVLQEEAATITLDEKGQVHFPRLASLLAQDPVAETGMSSESVDFDLAVQAAVPMFYSTGPDGKLIHGRQQQGRAAEFVPMKTHRQLVNLSTVLVRTNVVKMSLARSVRAGQVIKDGDERRVILTAAHVYRSSAAGGGVASEAFSKYWLARLAQ